MAAIVPVTIIVLWVVLATFIIYTTGEMGVWFTAAVTLAALAIISIYLYTLVSDMGYYGLGQRTLQCASLNRWLAIEIIVMLIAALATTGSDPYYFMAAGYWVFVGVEVASRAGINTEAFGKRRINPAEPMRDGKLMQKALGFKVIAHFIFLLLALGYLGPHLAYKDSRAADNDDDN